MRHKSTALFLVLAAIIALFGVSLVTAEETTLQFNLTGAATGDTDTLIIDAVEEDAEITLTVLSSVGEWQLDIVGPDNNVEETLTSVDFEGGELFINVEVDDDGGNYGLIFTVTGADAAEISGTIVIVTEDDDDDDCGDDDDDDGDDNGDDDNNGDDCGDDDDDFDPINIGTSVKIFIVINFDGSFTCNFYGIDDNDDDNEDDDGGSFIVISITSIQIQAILAEYDLENLTENILLAESEDGLYTLWYLTTGEYQINSKPDKEGKVEVLIYDTFPPTKTYRKDFNVYNVFNVQDEGDDD